MPDPLKPVGCAPTVAHIRLMPPRGARARAPQATQHVTSQYEQLQRQLVQVPIVISSKEGTPKDKSTRTHTQAHTWAETVNQCPQRTPVSMANRMW